MSGKGKGKGKSKKKDKTKLKANEFEIFNNCIDLIRFGYDVIKYTALRYQVPESCIAIWDADANNYGCDDFILTVFMRISKYQITCRYECHATFKQRYEENKLANPECIGTLLYDVMYKQTKGFQMTPFKIVHISLSIACELFLFLYSKDVTLHPKKLAKYWFECYLKLNKKDFEGGLEEMYNRTSGRELKDIDAFLYEFIEVHCLPYNTSAINPDLRNIFDISFEETLTLEETEAMAKEYELVHEIAERVSGIKIVEPPSPHLATGFNLPERTGTPLHQASQSCSSFAESTQDLPITSPEIQPCLKPLLSTKERWEKLKSKYPFPSKVTSSETKQRSDQKPSVSIATGTAQYYEHQGATPKDRVQNTGSSGLQTFESSTRSSGEGSLGSLTLESSIVTGAAQSYGHQGATPKVRVQNTGSSGLKTGESSSRSNGKGSLGSLTLESSIVTGAAQSYKHQGAKPKVRVQNTGSFGLQTGESSSRSSGEGSLGSLRSESLIATVTALYHEHQEATRKVRVQNTGSSGLQTGEPSLSSSEEQGLLSLDSSETK